MLYLEVQRTWPDGTGRIFLMIGFCFRNLCSGAGRRLVTAAFLASTMSVGLFSSVMDVPRVALLLLAVCSTKPNQETKVSG